MDAVRLAVRSSHSPAAVETQPVTKPQSRGLVRTLGLWDVTAITAGTILGSAIFQAAAFVPREVPHPTLALVLRVAGGVIAIAGALTYAELGTMFPEAGGRYEYLRQAFGPLWGFLFGWTSLVAIQSGANAFLGAGVRRVSRRVLSVRLPDARDRVDPGGIVDVGANDRATRRRVGDRAAIGGELRRHEARGERSGRADRPSNSCRWPR